MGERVARKKRRISKAQKWQYLGLAVLGLITTAVVAFTLTPPKPSLEVRAPVAQQPPPASAAPTATPSQAAPAFAIPKGRPVRVLFTGDSLSSGFFASTKAKAFPSLVGERLGNVEVTQAALAHQTLTTVSRVTDVPAGLDLAVVELGTNDVGVPTPMPTFRAQYGDLLAKIQAKSPGATIVCLGTWSPTGQAYDESIANACTKVKGRYVSLADADASIANHGPAGVQTQAGISDEFHPNDSGHRAIADLVISALGL